MSINNALQLSLALIVGTSMHGPARADWHNTRWGMTATEVRAAYPSAVEVCGSHACSLSIGATEFGGLAWTKGSFHFDTRGRLRSVYLQADSGYATVRERLIAQFGPPISEDEAAPAPLGTVTWSNDKAVFRDTRKANLVTLTGLRIGSSSSVALSYEKLPATF